MSEFQFNGHTAKEIDKMIAFYEMHHPPFPFKTDPNVPKDTVYLMNKDKIAGEIENNKKEREKEGVIFGGLEYDKSPGIILTPDFLKEVVHGFRQYRSDNVMPHVTKKHDEAPEVDKLNIYQDTEKDIALQILFIELSDSVIADVRKLQPEVLGSDFSRTQRLLVGHIAGMSETPKMHVNSTRLTFDEFEDEKRDLEQWASSGTFWGDEKPVPRMEYNPLDCEYRFHSGLGSPLTIGTREDLRQWERLVGKEIPIYKPRKFTYNWEEFPREFVPKDVDIPLSRFNEVNCNFGVATTLKSINKELGKLPFRASMFTMRVDDE